MPILVTILTSVASFIGVTMRNAYKQHIDTHTKKDIVDHTVGYVEQVFKDLKGQEKFDKAKEKALEWFKQKGIKISDTELEILIESAVSVLQQGVHKAS
jgi:Asp-tRNA(Asn)/Glu-tRNA(Gln) amidotransferase A subunit family amidase